MELQLEQVGEDVVLILSPEFLVRFGLAEGDELVATVTDRAIELRRAPGKPKDDDSPV